MRVLLTGSSGQIGTNLGLWLRRDGHEVFGIDNRPNAWTDEFPYLLQDLAGHQAPLPDDGDDGTYPEVDVVVHLAAHAKVHQLVHQPRRALENAVMTFNVLEYARQRNVPIVFSSSREVYGDVHRFEAYGEQAADFALTESTYSASKIAGEAFVYSYARCYGLRYLVFRFSNVYGRFDNDLDRMVRVIPLFIHSMLRDEPVTVFGGHAKTLDFTYVDDCVEGVVRGIESLVDGTVVNQTINLAYGRGNTLVHCAERIAAELGVRPRMTMAPSLLGEVTHYVADLSKARELLDYDPRVPLEEGIERAVAWFRQHRESHPEEDRPVTAHYEATSRARQMERVEEVAQRRRGEHAEARVGGPEAAPGTRSAQQA